jgi:ArsR family transcriptional regulator, arsenate/arsenite/antimonite-responsive transcriptional repressor
MMNTEDAVSSLSALAHKKRLEIFRLLVQTGPAGLSVGEIAAKTGVAGATLNHHLAQLNHAGLVKSRQEGRYVFHTTNFQAMTDLMGFLMENCCGGQQICCPPEIAACGETATAK